jgi:dCTP deaminase
MILVQGVFLSWLTGQEITKQVRKGLIRINPFDESQCNPNSYDYRLSPFLKKLKFNSSFDGKACIDPRKEMIYEEIVIPETGYLLETPNAYLGHTIEKFGSNIFASLVTGKSSVGRLFIKNHACAGLVDLGFHGHITLEITAKLNTVIYPYMRLGQIFWFSTSGERKLYQGKYLDTNDGTPSKIAEDWDEEKGWQ